MARDGSISNPDGKGGFGDNPQNRNPGGWDKTTSIPYLYNKFGRMKKSEREAYKKEHVDDLTSFETIALNMIDSAQEDAVKTKGISLNVAREITDRTDGRPKQTTSLLNGDTPFAPPVLVQFVGEDITGDETRE